MGLIDSFNPIGGVAGGAMNGFDTLVGDMLTGGAMSNAKSVADTNKAQEGLADKQMAFQERMSNSAYTRAMADMRNAGLNPILAGQNGGASTPNGAMAQLTPPRTGDVGAGLFGTAKEIFSLGMLGKKTNSEVDVNKAQAGLSDATVQKVTANAKESEENTNYTAQLVKKAEADTRASKAEATLRELELGPAAARNATDTKLAPMDAILERIYNAAGSLGSAFRNFSSGKQSSPSGSWSKNYNRKLP